MKNKFRIVFYFLLLSSAVIADGGNRSDSLQKVINSDAPDSVKAGAYYRLAFDEMLSNPTQALSHINKSLLLYRTEDFPFKRFYKKAQIFRVLGQVDSSIYYTNLVLNEATKKKQYSFISDAYAEFGLISLSQNNFNKAIEYFNKQIATIKKNKLQVEYSGVYNNIGIAYGNKGDWDMAFEYFSRSLKDDITHDRPHFLGNDYNNLGIVFLVKNKPDSASKYFRTSLAYRRKTNDLLGIGGSLNNLALLENDRNSYKMALNYADSAMNIASENGFKKLQVEVYDTYDQIYSKMGDFKKAYESLSKKNKLNTSFEKEELNNKIQQLESDLELGQKQAQLLEKDLALTKSEQQKQKQLGIIVLAVILLVALSFFMFNFSRNNTILKERNTIITKQKLLIEEKHKDITDSINYAQKIQSALIVSEEKLRQSIPESFIIFKPRDVVSGDFYWFSNVEDFKILVLADCTGHGVPGAFMSMIGITLLNQIVNEKKIISPAAVLNNLRREIITALSTDDSDKQDGMDLAVIAFNQTELIYSGANNDIIVSDRNGLRILKANKQPVGNYEKQEDFTEEKIVINNGLKIYLFSDGVVDQFGGAEGKKLKIRQFRTWLNEIADREMSAQKDFLVKNLEEWQKGFDQTDDISLIGIKLA